MTVWTPDGPGREAWRLVGQLQLAQACCCLDFSAEGDALLVASGALHGSHSLSPGSESAQNVRKVQQWFRKGLANPESRVPAHTHVRTETRSACNAQLLLSVTVG